MAPLNPALFLRLPGAPRATGQRMLQCAKRSSVGRRGDSRNGGHALIPATRDSRPSRQPTISEGETARAGNKASDDTAADVRARVVTDRRRKAAFACAAVVLLGLTVELTRSDPGPGPRHAGPQRPAETTIHAASPPASELHEAGDRAGHRPLIQRRHDRQARRHQPRRASVSRRIHSPSRPREARAATAAARAFLAGYLPYSYGRARRGADPSGGDPRCCASWRRRRRECRRASPGLARGSISVHAEAATGGLGRRRRGRGRGRPAAVPHPARGARRRPPLDRDRGQRLTPVSVLVEPQSPGGCSPRAPPRSRCSGLLLVAARRDADGRAGAAELVRAGSRERATRRLLWRWPTSRATTCSGSARPGTGTGWTGA